MQAVSLRRGLTALVAATAVLVSGAVTTTESQAKLSDSDCRKLVKGMKVSTSPLAQLWTRDEVKKLAKELGVSVDGHALITKEEVVQLQIKSKLRPAEVVDLLQKVDLNSDSEIKKAMRDMALDDIRTLPCWMSPQAASRVMKASGWKIASKSSRSSGMLTFYKASSSNKASKVVRVSSRDLDRKDVTRLKKALRVSASGFNRLLFKAFPSGTDDVAWE